MMDSSIEVLVMIAVSEDGLVSSSIVESCRIVQKRQHEQWLKDIKESPRLWTLKTIKTRINLPVQYEEIE